MTGTITATLATLKGDTETASTPITVNLVNPCDTTAFDNQTPADIQISAVVGGSATPFQLNSVDFSDTAGVTHNIAMLCGARSYSIPADSYLTLDQVTDTLNLDASHPSTVPQVYTVTLTVGLENFPSTPTVDVSV